MGGSFIKFSKEFVVPVTLKIYSSLERGNVDVGDVK